MSAMSLSVSSLVSVCCRNYVIISIEVFLGNPLMLSLLLTNIFLIPY